MIYIIVHTVINTKGKHEEANARIIGAYLHKDIAINEAEEWIKATRTSDINIKRITETQWYFWFDEKEKTYGGYVEVNGTELDKGLSFDDCFNGLEE